MVQALSGEGLLGNAVGWGRPFAALFDSSRVNIGSRSRGGRSSRTFIADGLNDGT
jgi:hypothetical protein